MNKGSIAVASQMLDEARADVAQADQKASILFAALGVGYGVVIGGILSSGFDPSALSFAGTTTWWIGAAAGAAAVVCAALAIWPRYTVKSESGVVTYWAHAASFESWRALSKAIAAQDPKDVDRTAHQLWRLSLIVQTKYRYVRVAMVLAAVAGLLLVVSTTLFR